MWGRLHPREQIMQQSPASDPHLLQVQYLLMPAPLALYELLELLVK